MFRRFSVNFALFSIALDAVIVFGALLSARSLRPWLGQFKWFEPLGPPIHLPVAIYIFFPILWVSIFMLFSVYDGRRNLRITTELTSITLGTLLASMALAGTLYLTYRDLSRVIFVTFVVLAYLAMLSWRILARIGFRLKAEQPATQRRVLIIGAGPVGQEMQTKLQTTPWLGLQFVGYLDDDPQKRLQNQSILGKLSDARRVIHDHHIQDVVIALPPRAYDRVSQLVSDLHDQPVKVWIIPDYFHLALHKAEIEEFAEMPMLDLRAPALSDYERLVKRAFDLTLAFILLPLVLPLMGLIALLIKLDNPGPAIFIQKRVGENGQLFEMYKFRTMVTNAEALRHLVETTDENGNFIHKTENDPRVTRIGRILRKTSLDELPQLFNVIKGEMSIVGPRPELPYLVERYQPWQRKRFAVPQGITGWWQVNGRSDKPMHLHTEDDLYYVQHYSLWLDIYILFKTAWVVLRGKGAY